jgi:hypothetical protein
MRSNEQTRTLEEREPLRLDAVQGTPDPKRSHWADRDAKRCRAITCSEAVVFT